MLKFSIPKTSETIIQTKCPQFSTIFMTIIGEYSGTIFLQESSLIFKGTMIKNDIGDSNIYNKYKYIEIPYSTIEFIFFSEFCHLETRSELYTKSKSKLEAKIKQ